MTLQRAATLHTDNTVVDNSGTADIRRITGSWTTYAVTAVVNNVQASNVERRFDPETGGDTTVQNAATQCDGKGFAVPTADMSDATGCPASIAAQNMTLTYSVNFFGSGAGSGGSDVFTPRCSLWKWNTSSDTATLIIGGSGTAVSRVNVLFAYGPELFAASVTLAVPATTFAANEVLLLVSGGNLAAAAGALGGARSFAVRLNVAASPLIMVFATQGMRQACTSSTDLVGDGVVTRAFDVGLSRDAVGDGVGTESRLVTASKSFDLVGDGVADMSRLVTAARAFDLVGDGVSTRDGVVVGLPRDAVGDGVATRDGFAAAMSDDVVGDGVATRVVDVALARELIGDGVVDYTKPLTAARSFDLVADGVTGGTITLPIDEVPEGGGGTTIVRRPIYIFDD